MLPPAAAVNSFMPPWKSPAALILSCAKPPIAPAAFVATSTVSAPMCISAPVAILSNDSKPPPALFVAPVVWLPKSSSALLALPSEA